MKPTYYEEYLSNTYIKFNNSLEKEKIEIIKEKEEKKKKKLNLIEEKKRIKLKLTEEKKRIKLDSLENTKFDNSLLNPSSQLKILSIYSIKEFNITKNTYNFISLDFLLDLVKEHKRIFITLSNNSFTFRIEDNDYNCKCCNNEYLRHLIDTKEMLSNTYIMEHNIKQCIKLN